MAIGNMQVAQKFCPTCNKIVKVERNSMTWGMGDLIMLVITVGVWIPLKFIFHWATSPWRCSQCGTRAK